MSINIIFKIGEVQRKLHSKKAAQLKTLKECVKIVKGEGCLENLSMSSAECHPGVQLFILRVDFRHNQAFSQFQCGLSGVF